VPTYQYACTECDERLEVRQSFTDDALTVCPSCEGRLRKVFNAVGVVFKGSGFYKTDSRKTPDSGGSGKEPGSDKGSGKEPGSDKGSDTGSGKESGGSSTKSGDSSASSGRSSGSSGSSKSSAA
jgi:putative FmdB family regulatory protein